MTEHSLTCQSGTLLPVSGTPYCPGPDLVRVANVAFKEQLSVTDKYLNTQNFSIYLSINASM